MRSLAISKSISTDNHLIIILYMCKLGICKIRNLTLKTQIWKHNVNKKGANTTICSIFFPYFEKRQWEKTKRKKTSDIAHSVKRKKKG